MEPGLANVFSYTKLASQKNLDSVTPANPISHFPKPTDDDYYNGYMERYFIQKANDIDAPIFEIDVSKSSGEQFKDYYAIVSIQWRLTGIPQEIMESNSNSVRAAITTIPNISHYLTNLLQFAKVK
jgi:hypothetical protein